MDVLKIIGITKKFSLQVESLSLILKSHMRLCDAFYEFYLIDSSIFPFTFL